MQIYSCNSFSNFQQSIKQCTRRLAADKSEEVKHWVILRGKNERFLMYKDWMRWMERCYKKWSVCRSYILSHPLSLRPKCLSFDVPARSQIYTDCFILQYFNAQAELPSSDLATRTDNFFVVFGGFWRTNFPFSFRQKTGNLHYRLVRWFPSTIYFLLFGCRCVLLMTDAGMSSKITGNHRKGMVCTF